MTLTQRLEQTKAQFEQAKANANFLAGQLALLEIMIAEEAKEGLNGSAIAEENDEGKLAVP